MFKSFIIYDVSIYHKDYPDTKGETYEFRI